MWDVLIWFNLLLWPEVSLFLHNLWLFVWSVHQNIDCIILIELDIFLFLLLVFAVIFCQAFIGDPTHPALLLEWLKLTESCVDYFIPKLLLLCCVLSGWKDGVQDVLGVCVCQILWIKFSVLDERLFTLTCFLPELDTSTGFEYLTRLWGWLKLEGPVEDICNFCNLNIKMWIFVFKGHHKLKKSWEISTIHTI